MLPGLIVHLGQVTLAEATRIAGYMLVAYAGAQFFAGPVLGNLGDRFGRRPILLFSTLAFALDYLLMAAAPTLAWLFVGRLIAGVAGATYGPANAVLADVTEPEKRGATFGLMGAAFGLGFILGPAIGGLLAGFGTRAPFIAAAALAGLNALWIAPRAARDAAAGAAPPLPLARRPYLRCVPAAFQAGGGAAPLLARRLALAARAQCLSGDLGILGRAGASLERGADRLVARRRGPRHGASPRRSSPAGRSPASARRGPW